jgi:predicted nucleic acid-binding protein
VKGYLVDTNIPSELTRETPDARVAAFLKNAKFRELGFESASRGGLKKYAGLHFEPDGGRRVRI